MLLNVQHRRNKWPPCLSSTSPILFRFQCLQLTSVYHPAMNLTEDLHDRLTLYNGSQHQLSKRPLKAIDSNVTKSVFFKLASILVSIKIPA